MSNTLKEYGKYCLVYLSGIDARYEILITTEKGSDIIFQTTKPNDAWEKMYEIIRKNI